MSYTPAIFATSFCYVLDKLCPGNRMSISAKLAVERLRMTFYPFSWSMEFWAGTGKPCKSRVSCVVPIITHYQWLDNDDVGSDGWTCRALHYFDDNAEISLSDPKVDFSETELFGGEY